MIFFVLVFFINTLITEEVSFMDISFPYLWLRSKLKVADLEKSQRDGRAQEQRVLDGFLGQQGSIGGAWRD